MVDAAYGGYDAAVRAGWRWHASPNHGSDSHNHAWWPPQSLLDAAARDGGTVLKLPLGTIAVRGFLDRARQAGRL